MSRFTIQTDGKGNTWCIVTSVEVTVYDSLRGRRVTLTNYQELIDILGGGLEAHYVGKTKDGGYILVHDRAWDLDLPNNIRFPNLKGTVVVAHQTGWNALPAFKPLEGLGN